MKKHIRQILPILLLIMVFVFSPSFDYWKYKLIFKNDEIVFLDVKQSNVKTYQDLLNLKEFEGRPSLIYVNTRFDYDFLKDEAPYILRLYKNLHRSNINFIYTAIGLEDEADNKRIWFVKMNELGLNGIHVSLADEFEEYESLIIIKKNSTNSETWNIPKYIIANENGLKTDTIYNFMHKTNHLAEMIENKFKN